MKGPVVDAEDIVVEDTGCGAFQVDVRAPGLRFLADEPVDRGGLGSGPAPFDLLCTALGACTAITLKLYARRQGWALTRVRVRVAHQKELTTRADLFLREIRLSGELGPTERARLMEIAERCPVHRALTAGARIETQAGDPQTIAALQLRRPAGAASDHSAISRSG
jgi:putative redox protein